LDAASPRRRCIFTIATGLVLITKQARKIRVPSAVAVPRVRRRAIPKKQLRAVGWVDVVLSEPEGAMSGADALASLTWDHFSTPS